LWNQTITIEDFEGPPSIQQVLAPAIEELQGGETDPDLPRMVDGKIFQWKAYRMIMRHSFDMMLSLTTRTLEDVLSDNSFKTEPKNEIVPTEPEKAVETSPTTPSTTSSPVASVPGSPPHTKRENNHTTAPAKPNSNLKKQKSEQEIKKEKEPSTDPPKREKEPDPKRQRLTRSDRSNK